MADVKVALDTSKGRPWAAEMISSYGRKFLVGTGCGGCVGRISELLAREAVPA